MDDDEIRDALNGVANRRGLTFAHLAGRDYVLLAKTDGPGFTAVRVTPSA